jgi:phosphoglycerate dehydrogenase-like enzyme
MTDRKLLVYLKSDVDSFSIKKRNLERIRGEFPAVDVVEATCREEFLERLPDAEWVMTWVFRPEWYEKAPRLERVFTPAAGHDWVTPDPSGRVRCTFGRFHGRIMRESLLAMMLHFNRRVYLSPEKRGKMEWDRRAYDGSACLFSQRVLIVGYGAIGRSAAELLKGFGAKITGVKRDVAGFENDPFAERVVTFDRIGDELPDADHVVLVLPGGDETDGIFTRKEFDLMKPGSHLYNLGRGNCYREDDLVRALEKGPLGGAGIDVFQNEPLPQSSRLWQLPNVIITPHASAITREYMDLYIEEWLETVRG